ncbi:MAG: protein kinase [Xanthomonadales bacterium]|nr:protein kinase [Xanthomonadales bacterium]MBK7143920.1 protein kinase [Xanthomonadales bacterium]
MDPSALDRFRTGQALRGQLLRELVDGAVAPARAGPWRLDERIGIGGMGEVWRAHRVEGGFEQVAALKLVRAGIDSELLRTRFEQERRILARLEHPAIAHLLDGGLTEDGRPFFAMEFVDGESIDAWAVRVQPTTDAVLRLFVGICGAVDYAHHNLIVHRDLKPSNILIDGEGRPKLLDFGIAKLLDEEADGSATQLRALTPAYAAPEQFNGNPVTTATDVYALGLILYQVIAGTLPAERDTGRALGALAEVEISTGPVRRSARRETAVPPPPNAIGHDLDAIVLKALRLDPARRYPSAAALSDDLCRLLDGLPVSARPDTVGYRTRRFVRRHRSAVAAAGVALFALVAGLGVALWQAQVAQRSAARMQVEMQRAEAASLRAEAARDFLLELVEAGNPNLVGGDVRRTVREMLLSASAKIERRFAGEPLVQVELRLSVARALRAHGEPGAALELVEAALAQLGEAAPVDPVLLGTGLQTRASLRAAASEFVAAETDVERALTLLRQAPDSPAVREQRRAANSTLALVYSATGREPAALDLRRADLEERSHELGETHPDLAPAWYNLGVSNFRAERFAEALADLQRSEAILAAAGSAQTVSPRRLYVWLMLAQTLAALDRFAEADTWLQRAQALLDEGVARERPDLDLMTLKCRIIVAWLGMRRDEASRLLAQAWERINADEQADISFPALHWVGILLAEGRATEAETLAGRALAEIRERRGEEDLVTRHLRAAKLYAGFLQRRQAADLAELQGLAEALRDAPTRRQFGQVAAWLAQAIDASDSAAAARWGSEAEAALAAIYGAEHPWTRSRAGTRISP